MVGGSTHSPFCPLAVLFLLLLSWVGINKLNRIYRTPLATGSRLGFGDTPVIYFAAVWPSGVGKPMYECGPQKRILTTLLPWTTRKKEPQSPSPSNSWRFMFPPLE